ncbi:PIN domain-containing protein [Mucilaginibacter sp. 44-25]|uniref:type II toxin-antitoxin system VapC family toxin n=1 Tax=Mucilaginibacter sp. 44-25 TaxID=1895794 RepID=UPI00095E9896|nr:PIN domain-containing protein [Mucilaginibacter sp. 44-25]OJW12560.1 MAG: hypothetical protein BGO48_05560 [Mucilaginibacter sp. 44-25]
MTYKTVFVDSDIILDMMLERDPFNKFSKMLFQEAKTKSFAIYTSALVFANLHYLIAKYFDRNIAKEQLRVLSKLITIISFDEEHVKLALSSEHVDFEDTVQYQIANKNNCDLIITRNTKHYKRFDIPVLTAEQFLRQL